MPTRAALPTFRVTFLHVRSGARWTTVVRAGSQYLAHRRGRLLLEAHLRDTAGRAEEWAHYGTAEVPRE